MDIQIYDPFAAYLGGPPEVERFSITIFDAAKLAGHLCPSITGAFLVSRAAVHALFPDTLTCERGKIAIDISASKTEGAYGPIGHVLSYITGAWDESGFAGLNGHFIRRNLLRFNSMRVKPGWYRFERLDTGKVVEVRYDPSRANVITSPDADFAQAWQARVRAILDSKDVLEVVEKN